MTLTSSVLHAVDDTSAAAQLTFTVNGSDAGSVYVNGRELAAGGTFTQADIDGGKVSFLAGTSSSSSGTVHLTLTDTDGATVAIDLPVTQTPFSLIQTEAKWGGYWGTSGRDFLKGTGNADQMTGGDGNDVILGGGGNDSINAGAGHDRIDGGAGNDFITGDDGDDFIFGGAGKDTIYAGNGNDVLSGGAVDGDILSGGSGTDRYVFNIGDGRDRIEGLNRSEGDVLDLRAFQSVLGDIDSWSELKASAKSRRRNMAETRSSISAMAMS